MSHLSLTHTNIDVSDQLTVRYLKKRLKKLNRLIRTADASQADYVNRDRVAFQLQDALSARRALINRLAVPALSAKAQL